MVSGGSDPAQLFGKLVELGLIREGGSERDGEREATQERGASRGAPITVTKLPTMLCYTAQKICLDQFTSYDIVYLICPFYAGKIDIQLCRSKPWTTY